MASANNDPEDHDKKEGATDRSPKKIILAKWRTRFGAWLIDVIIVWIGIGILFQLLSLPFWFFDYNNETQSPDLSNGTQLFYYHDSDSDTRINLTWNPVPIGITFFIDSFIFLAYWTYFESTTGQSIGKKLLKIKTVDLSGNKVDTKSAVMESIGKSFLLPIDVFFGWLFSNDLRQRVFNRMSDTIVIKADPEERIVVKARSEGKGGFDNIEITKG